MQPFVPVLASLCLWASLSSAMVAPPGELPVSPVGAVAAKVNEKPIYYSQLQPRVDEALSRFRKYGAATVSDQTRRVIESEELNRQIAWELLAQAAERMFSAPAMVGKKDNGTGTISLEPAGTGAVRRSMLVERYLAQRGLEDLAVPEAELKKYYDQNRQSFVEPASVNVSHILVKLPQDPSPEQVAEARLNAALIREELMEGVEFGDLARQFSDCATARTGGDLGYISRGYMPAEFDRVAFSLEEGETSEPVRTKHGFHIIRIFDKSPERMKPFNEVREMIEGLLLKRIQAKVIEQIVEELKREFKVTIYLK